MDVKTHKKRYHKLMSLVSNFIGDISSLQFGNKSNVTNTFDINDDTFSKLLDKQMEVGEVKDKNGINLSQLGMPAGIDIEPFDGILENNSEMESVSPIQDNIQEKTTTSETVTFFDSLLNSNTQDNKHSELFDFAKRQATNLYNQYSRSVVTDVNEFVQDIKSMI